MRFVKVRFLLDGCGVIYDPLNPITLDGLDYLVQGIRHKRFQKCGSACVQRDDIPLSQRISFVQSVIDGKRVNHASALFPTEPLNREIVYVRKKFNEDRFHLASGSIDNGSGIYRNYVIPYEKIITRELYGYAALKDENEDTRYGRPRRMLMTAFRNVIHALGKKTADGFGKVNKILIEYIDEDFSLVKDGKAMRYLPKAGGVSRRVIPPYWNCVDRIETCNVGDAYALEDHTVEAWKHYSGAI